VLAQAVGDPGGAGLGHTDPAEVEPEVAVRPWAGVRWQN